MSAAPAARSATSPYIGLTHFTEDEAALFFGRSRERDVILANLRARRVTLLYGESGVGKSSLLRAGVVHELRELARRDFEDPDLGRPEYVPAIAASWSDDPLGTLLGALAEAVAPFVRGSFRPPASRRLDAAIDDLAAQADARLLVILDQLEEYFLYHPDEAGVGTLATELPRALLRPHLRASFLLSIREDALAKLDRFKRDVPELFHTVLRIGPLDRNAAREAIVRPLRAFAGCGPREAEPALVDAVLDQVSAGQLVLEGSGQGRVERDGANPAVRAIEAPYLQLVLTRLWEEEDDPEVLTLATLERLGGAEAIVRTHLDGALGMLPDAEQAVAADALRYLVTPSGTKIALSAQDLTSFTGRDEVAPVLEKLTESGARILRAVSAPPGQAGPPRYEIFHDVLGAAVLDWRSRYVRDQERLELERRAVAERERLEQEKREAEEREQLERRRARTFRAVAAAALGLLVAVCAILAYALVQKAHAEHEQRASESQALAAEARNALRDGRLGAAVPLALAAYERSRTTAAEEVLISAVEQSNGLRRLLRFGAAVEGTALDPRGATVAVATGRTLVVRRTTGARVVKAVEPATVRGVAFSRDGSLLAAARDDGAVALFRVRRDGRGEAAAVERLRVLATRGGLAKAVAFSADRRWLAAATGDGVVVWPLRGVAAGRARLLRPGGDFARSVAFCPVRHGREPAVAAAFADGRVVLWPSPLGGVRARVLQGAGPQAAGAVACSADGATLAAGGDDEVITLFRLGGAAGATRLTRLSGHSGGIETLAFSADGRVLASGGDDHSVILWDMRHERELGPALRAHTQPVVAVGFDRRGKLAVASTDGRVSIWDAAAVARAGGGLDVTRNPRNRLRDAAFGDGVFAAVTSRNNILVRDARRPDRAGRVPEIHVPATSIAVDAGGRWVALGFKTSVQLFQRAGSVPVERPLGGRTGVERVALARDGRLAAALPGGAIRFWREPPRSRRFVDLQAPGRPGSASALAVAPDGGAVSAAYGDRVVLWRAGRRPVVLGGTGDVADLAFGGGGKLLAAGGEAIHVWNVENGRLLESFPAGAEAVAVSGDGRWLAASGPDGSVRLWDIDAHRQLGEALPTPPHVPVAALAFTRPASLAAAYRDGTAAAWDLSRWRTQTRFKTIKQSLLRAIGGG